MIVGIGNDIVHMRRMQGVLTRHPQRFPSRLLTTAESRHPKAAQLSYLAGRWAAKEALGKALGRGLHAPLLLQQITVLNDVTGKPFFRFTDTLQRYLTAQGVQYCHLSITHDGDYTLATVIAER